MKRTEALNLQKLEFFQNIAILVEVLLFDKFHFKIEFRALELWPNLTPAFKSSFVFSPNLERRWPLKTDVLLFPDAVSLLLYLVM